MRKQNVIIFSSSKSLDVVKELCAELNKRNDINAVNWKEYFETVYPEDYRIKKSYPLFSFLTKRIPSFDFAIVVAGKDDMISENQENPFNEKYRMRDNVIFELGMCCMALGETRVILLRQKGVRLFADLRGNNEDLSRDSNNHSTPLTVDNIQLTAFEYDFEQNISPAEETEDIVKYIESTADNYAPVIVGSACALASGYSGNFVQTIAFAFKNYAEGKNVMLNISGNEELLDLCKDLKNLEIHILLPSVTAYLNNTATFAQPRTVCEMLYNDPQLGIIQNCQINDDGRKIMFACKRVGQKLYIIDVPTTILASYKIAKQILNINDNANEEGLEVQYMSKEIDMFNATLNRQNMSSFPVEVKVNDIYFDETIDRKNIPWLYE